jgi:hypothetical protein
MLVVAVGACGDDDASAPSPTGASSGGIEVLGPDADMNGMSTADLLGTYAVGVVETPAEDSFVADPATCDMGLSTGDVYFAPTPGEPGDLATTCTMSADQTLMVAPASAFCIDAPDQGGTADAACLDDLWDLTGSSLTIDGVEVDGLDAYEVDSEVMDVTLPEGSIFEEHGVPAGPSSTIARGQVVLVDGLAPGDHTVEMGFDFGDGEFAGSLTIDLTVATTPG